jgi:hypothetical protein
MTQWCSTALGRLGHHARGGTGRLSTAPGCQAGPRGRLKKRTLTNLYNARTAWLAMAHEKRDRAVAAAYGWDDYTSAMPDEEILMRLLALNQARAEKT